MDEGVSAFNIASFILSLQSLYFRLRSEDLFFFFLSKKLKFNSSDFRNTAQLIINVGDVNDNRPIFFLKRYEVRLQENRLEFEIPAMIEAFDLDLNGTK